MQLIIDVGNTSVKFALFQGQTFLFVHRGGEEVLSDILKNNKIHLAIISAVAQSEWIESMLLKHNISFLNLSHKTPVPIVNKYKTPQTLGDDRLANVVAAQSLYPNKNVLTIDCGTCIKFDMITDDRIYKGGAISPGVHMRFKALNKQTHQLPEVKLESIDYLIGESSEESIRSGVINGCVFEIEGAIKGYKEALYDYLTVIITGGDGNYFEKALNCNIFAEPNLTLIGLNEILLYNKK